MGKLANLLEGLQSLNSEASSMIAPAAVGLGLLGSSDESEAGIVKSLANFIPTKEAGRVKVYEGDEAISPSNKRVVRYVKHDEHGEPISDLEVVTQGPSSKKATISNVYTDPNYRRSGHAESLLEAARQDFDVKHSKDLTNDGRAWARSVGSADPRLLAGIAGTGTAALAAPTAQDYINYLQGVPSRIEPMRFWDRVSNFMQTHDDKMLPVAKLAVTSPGDIANAIETTRNPEASLSEKVWSLLGVL